MNDMYIRPRRVPKCQSGEKIIIIIINLMPVSCSDEDIGGIPTMQSSYSAELKQNGICMEERSVHCECVGRNPRRHCAGY